MENDRIDRRRILIQNASMGVIYFMISGSVGYLTNETNDEAFSCS